MAPANADFPEMIRDLSLDIGLERLDLGFALLLTHLAPFVLGLAADGVLDLVEFGDAADDLGGDRRLGALEDLEEAASRVPARCPGAHRQRRRRRPEGRGCP